MKKINLIGILAIMFVTIFIIGCGGGGSGDDKDDGGINPPPPPPISDDVPSSEGIRRCTLCDDGIDVMAEDWLSKFGEKIFYVVLRAEKPNSARKIYIGGIVDGAEFIVHNQRVFAGEVTPEILGNLFGGAFYKFGSVETIDPKDSGNIEAVGFVKKAPFLKDLIDPAKVGSNEGCGKPYPVDSKNWEGKFPIGTLFFDFDLTRGKIKFNKKEPSQVMTFDCQRELSDEKRLEGQSLLPLGPKIVTTDGKIAGEVINANPPAR